MVRKRLVTVAVCAVLCFSAVLLPGCKKKPQAVEPGLRDTNIVLAQDGKTDFKIVLSPQANDKEQKGAEELKNIFREYTGATMEIVTDGDVRLSARSKLISIGNTSVLQQSGADTDADLGSSGFFIKRVDENVMIGSDGYFGALYGVYDFLENNLGVRFYGYGDVYYPEKKAVLYLKDFDYYEIPSFEYRTVSGKNLEYYDEDTMDRFRMTNHLNWIPGLTAHTTEALLPYSVYGEEHADWYAENGQELCFTSEGARRKMQEELQKKILTAEAYCDTVMIGTMDNWDKCNCQGCRESDAKYTYSGTYLRFVNALAEDMYDWETANGIHHYTYVAFAYRKTQSAPVSFETGKPVVLVSARDNVAVRFAPLDADFNHVLTDPVYNSDTKTAIETWQLVVKQLKVWSYMLNYNEELVWFNDDHTQKTNYEIYRQMGVTEILDQGQWDNLLPGFVAARSYVKAQLMWDLSVDPTAAMRDFISFHYGAASSEIQELYDIVNLRYRMIDEHFRQSGWKGQDALITRCYTHLETEFMSETYWPYAFLLQCRSLTDAAAEKVADDAVLSERVALESITADYLLLSLHSGKFSETDYGALIDTFEGNCRNCGVESYAEGAAEHPITQKVAYFRSKIQK